MLPVKEINHPCSRLIEAEPPPRSIKRSLLDYVDDIELYAEQTTKATNFRHSFNDIHCLAIKQ